MLSRWIATVLQGIGIGAANVIPGVSGGTMALIFGIYERLIEVTEAAVHIGLQVAKLNFSDALSSLKSIPWGFVIPLAAGIVLAPLIGARYIPTLLETYPEEARGLFFGLILASVAIPWLRIEKASASHWLLLAAGAVVAFLLAGLQASEIAEPSMLFVFVAGAVAMSAMILPGVSGAYLLLIIGLYAPILRAIDLLQVEIILVFGAGAALGLGAFSIFIAWLLRTMHDHTMAVLVGLMLGSLRALWPWMGENRELQLWSDSSNVVGIFSLLAVGVLISGSFLIWEMRSQNGNNQRTTTNLTDSEN